MNDVYREIILDHYKYPRNQGVLDNPDIETTQANTSCGDTLKLQLKLNKQGKVVKTAFSCHGCAISTAVSSLLTEVIEGKTISELEELGPEDIYKLIGGPVTTGRVSCATLALRALKQGVKAYKLKGTK